MHELNVCGLSCPLPVLRVREAVSSGKLPLRVTADAGAARDNIKRYAENLGLLVHEHAAEPRYILELSKA